jgi:hypothetical protein
MLRPYVVHEHATPRAIGSQPPTGTAADRPVSMVFGPWSHGGSRPSSVGGLRSPILRVSFFVFRVKVC